MNPTHQQSGFSLIEVMVAILILGIALVGLTQGIATALDSSKESELQTTAALLAAGQIELLRAQGDFADGEQEGDCGEGLPLYRWRQTISSTDIEGLHEVRVVVENSRTGKEIYELQTLLFQFPQDSTSGNSSSHRESTSRSRPGSRRSSYLGPQRIRFAGNIEHPTSNERNPMLQNRMKSQSGALGVKDGILSRGAELKSAVSPNCIRQGVAWFQGARIGSASQVANLRYSRMQSCATIQDARSECPMSEDSTLVLCSAPRQT